jgi:hypothetical protein
MNSLQDLNNHNNDFSIEYLDEREAQVVFSSTAPYTQVLTIREGKDHVLPLGIEIDEILGGEVLNIKLVVDLEKVITSSEELQEATVEWPSTLPSGVSISNTGYVWTLSGIVTKETWDLIKAPTVISRYTGHGEVTYNASIVWTQGNKSWDIYLTIQEGIDFFSNFEFYAQGYALHSTPVEFMAEYFMTSFSTAKRYATANLSSLFSQASSAMRRRSSPIPLNFVSSIATIANAKFSRKCNLLSNFIISSIANPIYAVLFGASSQFLYTKGTNEDLSGIPSLYTDFPDETFVVSINAKSSFNNLLTISSFGTSGSSSWDAQTKTLTLSGTVTQINTHLSTLKVETSSDNDFKFYLEYFIISDSDQEIHRYKTQLLDSNNSSLLLTSTTDETYIQNTITTISGGPKINSSQSGDYTYEIYANDETAIDNLTTTGVLPLYSQSSISSNIMTLSGNGLKLFLWDRNRSSPIRIYTRSSLKTAWQFNSSITVPSTVPYDGEHGTFNIIIDPQYTFRLVCNHDGSIFAVANNQVLIRYTGNSITMTAIKNMPTSILSYQVDEVTMLHMSKSGDKILIRNRSGSGGSSANMTLYSGDSNSQISTGFLSMANLIATADMSRSLRVDPFPDLSNPIPALPSKIEISSASGYDDISAIPVLQSRLYNASKMAVDEYMTRLFVRGNVYIRNGTTWALEQQIYSGDDPTSARLSDDGSMLAIELTNIVNIYKRTDTTWSLWYSINITFSAAVLQHRISRILNNGEIVVSPGTSYNSIISYARIQSYEWNNITKKFTITDVKNILNSVIDILSMTPVTNYARNIDLVYKLIAPDSSIQYKNQFVKYIYDPLCNLASNFSVSSYSNALFSARGSLSSVFTQYCLPGITTSSGANLLSTFTNYCNGVYANFLSLFSINSSYNYTRNSTTSLPVAVLESDVPTATYTVKISPYTVPHAVGTISTTNNDGGASFNNTTKEFTMVGTQDKINSYMSGLRIAPSTDDQYNYTLKYYAEYDGNPTTNSTQYQSLSSSGATILQPVRASDTYTLNTETNITGGPLPNATLSANNTVEVYAHDNAAVSSMITKNVTQYYKNTDLTVTAPTVEIADRTTNMAVSADGVVMVDRNKVYRRTAGNAAWALSTTLQNPPSNSYPDKTLIPGEATSVDISQDGARIIVGWGEAYYLSGGLAYNLGVVCIYHRNVNLSYSIVKTITLDPPLLIGWNLGRYVRMTNDGSKVYLLSDGTQQMFGFDGTTWNDLNVNFQAAPEMISKDFSTGIDMDANLVYMSNFNQITNTYASTTSFPRVNANAGPTTMSDNGNVIFVDRNLRTRSGNTWPITIVLGLYRDARISNDGAKIVTQIVQTNISNTIRVSSIGSSSLITEESIDIFSPSNNNNTVIAGFSDAVGIVFKYATNTSPWSTLIVSYDYNQATWNNVTKTLTINGPIAFLNDSIDKIWMTPATGYTQDIQLIYKCTTSASAITRRNQLVRKV